MEGMKATDALAAEEVPELKRDVFAALSRFKSRLGEVQARNH